jgi:hypothetical protein
MRLKPGTPASEAGVARRHGKSPQETVQILAIRGKRGYFENQF